MQENLQKLFKLNPTTRGLWGLKKYKILTCLVLNANENNIVENMTQSRIARKTNCSNAYTAYVIQNLCKNGFLAKTLNCTRNIYDLTPLFTTIQEENDND